MVCGLPSAALSVGLVLFGWFAFWHLLDFLYRADAPFPIFIGEVLSVFVLSGSLGFLYLSSSWFFVGHCPFGNKFLIIQKR